MNRMQALEIGVGVFVAAGFAALFVLAMKVSNLSSFAEGETYEVHARFENVGGLKVRAPVSVAGVRVGRVARIAYDATTYQAVVTLALGREHDQFPSDTSARIFTAGLLGEQYISLEPGGEEKLLGDGDRIELTQSALVLEQIVGQFLFSKVGEGSAN